MYTTDQDNWSDYTGNFYESPFNKQSSYGQRYNSKGFANDELPDTAHNWYEKRPVLEPDLSQMKENMGEDEVPYHREFPKYKPETTEKTEETFFTRPYNTPQYNARDVYSASKPVTGTEVPDLVESFTILGKEVNITSIVVVIICLLLLVLSVYYLMNKNKLRGMKMYGAGNYYLPVPREVELEELEQISQNFEPVNVNIPMKTYGGNESFDENFNEDW